MKLGTLCYIEKNNQYLMLHRTKKQNDMHRGRYVGLGGKFETGESPEDCVVREVFEESGLHIKNPQLRGILTFPGFFKQEDWYVFLFVATEFTGEMQPCEEGKLVWVDKNKLNELPMHGGDRYFLKWLDEHKGIFSAKYIYEHGVFKDYQLTVYE
ncbi:MAG: 8-oxo-dGTP diphosphatase [Defluviitaleaceae bacterium]|nr:8-oxo-dGTP diphosphatase [Defluviitaleaceae bacterium]